MQNPTWTKCHCGRVAKFTVRKTGYSGSTKAVCQLHLVWIVGQMLSGSWADYSLDVRRVL